jgi:O-succinylbenzoate synthase
MARKLMKLQRVTLREVRMKLVRPFETSFGRTETRRILLVEVDAEGVSGWGECVAGEGPFYAPETVETAWHITRDFLWPMLRGSEFSTAAEIDGMFSSVRGHNMAKGALEAAVWDAEARQKNLPLWKLLEAGAGVGPVDSRREIPCGVSIGLQENDDELERQVEKEMAAGYQRIKIKIKPGRDVAPVQRLRQHFPRIKLMVDANSAYTLRDLPILQELDAFYLMMIEQPLGWDDIFSHAEVQRKLQTPICLDECIHSTEHARAAIELRACGIINIKLGRVGGYSGALEIHNLCRERGVPVWCGGMLESGIGRAHNIALSTLPNFTLPGDVTASRRYWTEDIIEPEVTVSTHGTIKVPSGPGIGYEPRRERIEALTVRREELS